MTTAQLLGRITIDDVVDVIREDTDRSLMSMAGLDEDADTFAPSYACGAASRHLAGNQPSYGLSLLLRSLISFRERLKEVVALAVLMPIVASMGGIAGTQTLTLWYVRGIALGTGG